MAKTRVAFDALLDYVTDAKKYEEVRKAVAESGDANVDRLLQLVDKIAAIRGIETETSASLSGPTPDPERGEK